MTDAYKKMKKLIFLMMCLLASMTAMADDDLQYDLESAGVSQSGMTLVKVSVYVKKPKKATSELFKKAAVHGIIFRGVAESGVTGFSKQNALAGPAAAQQHGDYFQAFFDDGGGFMSYATLVEGTTESVKVGKQYRITRVVNVNTDALKRTLKDAGVIRGMTDGF